MSKLFIKNRKDQKVVVVVDETENAKGLAFVMHGLSGFKEQPHIQTFAQAFKEKGFTTVLFDTTNTYGESDGKYEDATTTNYFEDLEDVIAWSKSQPWYKQPFYLAGHSLGGISTILYTQKHPEEVKGLAPISTVVSGALSAEAHGKAVLESWEMTGWREEQSNAIPGLIKRLKWSHMVDRLTHDVLPNVHKLTMPVLLIVGEKDETTPLAHQQILLDKLPGEKELHTIKGAPHSFREPHELVELKQIFSDWIDTVETQT
jgi:pimeloyl-ACP methyl ester carboxylesterase